MKRILLVLFVVFALTGNAFAITNGFEAMSFRPTSEGGNYFGVWDSHAPKSRVWNVGTVVTYAYRPFQIMSGGSRVSGVLDNTFIEHFFGSVGIFDQWLSAGVDMPVAWWLNYKNPNIAGSPWENQTSLGDIRLNLKTTFVDIEKHRVGVALVPYIYFPTGQGKYYMGNGGVAGGGTVVVEGRPIDKLNIALNVGILGKRKFVFRNMEKGNMLTGGIAAGYNITEKLSASAELSVKTNLGSPFKHQLETPVEVIGGAKYAIGNTGVVVSAAAGGGIIHGGEAPAFRVLAGIGFESWRRAGKAHGAPQKFISDEVVHFEESSAVIGNVEEAKDLGSISDELRENEKCRAEILGHTDSTGSEPANMKLSNKRAHNVGRYIKMHGGIQEEQVKADGRGDKEPVGDNATAEGRAKNRRANVKVTCDK